MVRHVILWQLKDEFTAEKKAETARKIKEGLEGLQGRIPGLVEIHVQTEHLGSSNADLMLDSTFENEEALKIRGASRSPCGRERRGAPEYQEPGVSRF